MFWYILFGGAAASAIYAFTRGQNPLIWFFTSVPGLPLLALMPPANAKALGEQKRARRAVGDKVGMVVGGGVLALALVLKIVGI
jgi:hypothetical protein